MELTEITEDKRSTAQPLNIARRMFSNFSWTFVSEGLGKGVFFISNIYLARVLGVDSFGLFTLAMTITYYFWLAVDLGTNMYGIREIAKDKKNSEEIINTIMTIRVTSGIIIFFIYISVLMLLDIAEADRWVFSGAGLYLISYAFYTDWVFKGLEKFRFIAYGNIVSSLVYIIAVFRFIHEKEDVALAATVWAGSYLFGSGVLLYILLREQGIQLRPSFKLMVWWKHLRESLFFTFSGGLMMLYQYLPIVFLGVYFDRHAIGIFSAPYRIMLTVGSVGLLIAMSFYPVLTELYVKDRGKFHKTHRVFLLIMTAIGVPVGLMCSLFSEEIVNMLFGKDYFESIKVFIVLGWLVPLFLWRYCYGSVLFATGFHKIHFVATGSAVLSMVIMGPILISRYSVVGCAWAMLISEIIMLAVLIIISKRTFSKPGAC